MMKTVVVMFTVDTGPDGVLWHMQDIALKIEDTDAFTDVKVWDSIDDFEADREATAK